MAHRTAPLSPSPSRGYTLAELLVVVTVIAVLAAVAVPYFSGTGGLQSLSAARRIASDLEYAQNVAVTTQTPVTVTFTPATEGYSLSNASGTLNHPINKSAFIVDFRTEEEFAQLDLVSASFGDSDAAVTFDAMGSPDDAGTIVLQSGATSYRVSVAAATGKVSVESISP